MSEHSDRSTWELAGQAAALKAEQETKGLPLNESKFPALVEICSSVKILDHHELPVGTSFRILATAPLTPQKVLDVMLVWASDRIQEERTLS